MAVKLLARLTNLAGIGKQYLTASNTKIGDLVMDATYLYNIERSNNITVHPVESSAYVVDNAFSNPLTINLSCAILNAPMGYIATANNLINIFNGNILENATNYYKGKGKNIIAAYEILNDMIAQKTIVSVVTKLEVIENLMVEKINYTQDNTTHEALVFDITLKQVSFAESVTVDSNFFNQLNVKKDFKDSVSGKLNLGGRTTKSLNPVETQKASGVLNFYRAADRAVRNFF